MNRMLRALASILFVVVSPLVASGGWLIDGVGNRKVSQEISYGTTSGDAYRGDWGAGVSNLTAGALQRSAGEAQPLEGDLWLGAHRVAGRRFGPMAGWETPDGGDHFGEYAGAFAAGGHNVYMGRYAGFGATGSERMYLDYWWPDPGFGHNPLNDRMVFDADGRLLLGRGTDAPQGGAHGGELRGNWTITMGGETRSTWDAPTPLVVNLAGPILYEAAGGVLHFEIQWSANADFSDARSYSSATNTSGWYFYNGTGYQALPASGFESAFYYVHEGLGAVVFTVPDAVAADVYVRARSYNGADWSDYRTVYGSGTVVVNSSGTVAEGIRALDNQQEANAWNAGVVRYRETANGSYVEMSMRVGAEAYAWVELTSNAW